MYVPSAMQVPRGNDPVLPCKSVEVQPHAPWSLEEAGSGESWNVSLSFEVQGNSYYQAITVVTNNF